MVQMGDALANIGYNGGRFLLQASASDLQERRDAVLAALRNLVGSTQQAYGQEDWPRGLQAYQQLINRLDATGNSDLRALFQEANLARLMDDLIARVNVMNADGLRALGSTAVIQVQPMRRLIQLGRRLVDPQSPPLASFLLALEMFIEAFQYSSSGSRLIHIARPAIISYGLYGISGSDTATARLNDLVVARGKLAVALDCFLPCECTSSDVRCQIILDKLLYDIDRAIDALSLGSDPDGRGDAEIRAAAYGLIIETLPLDKAVVDPFLQAEIDYLRNQLTLVPRNQVPGLQSWLDDVLGIQRDYDDPGAGSIFNFNGCLLPNPNNPNQTSGQIVQIGQALASARQVLLANFIPPLGVAVPAPPPPLLPGITRIPGQFMNTVLQEMCMQEDAENQWKNLLQTMAPSCFPASQFVDATTMLVRLARAVHLFPPCGPVDISIPPDVATSLAGLVYQQRSEGGFAGGP
jgi:hypothetical protein